MRKFVRALWAVGSTALLLLVGGLVTAPAASAQPTQLTQPTWCGWQPGINAMVGAILGGDQPIYDGQGTACNTLAWSGAFDGIDLRCQVGSWYFILDTAKQMYGWVNTSEFAFYPGAVKGC